MSASRPCRLFTTTSRPGCTHGGSSGCAPSISRTTIHNDFGEIVRVEGVEPHVHMGSDIEAPSWTPIRAPFDGYTSTSYSPLGGYQVYVRGDRGYVFNAHLIAYGDLGWVSAGTVIGYVGATGDSTASHDHFEWHPWHGRAVDPYYLLSLACD